MPYAAPSLKACGCVVGRGQTCVHSRQRDRERKAAFDQKRPSAAERGYGGKWREARASFLKQHPRCERCGASSTIVHHRIAHKGDRKLFWDRKNWMPVCQPCHDGPLQSQERRK